MLERKIVFTVIVLANLNVCAGKLTVCEGKIPDAFCDIEISLENPCKNSLSFRGCKGEIGSSAHFGEVDEVSEEIGGIFRKYNESYFFDRQYELDCDHNFKACTPDETNPPKQAAFISKQTFTPEEISKNSEVPSNEAVLENQPTFNTCPLPIGESDEKSFCTPVNQVNQMIRTLLQAPPLERKSKRRNVENREVCPLPDLDFEEDLEAKCGNYSGVENREDCPLPELGLEERLESNSLCFEDKKVNEKLRKLLMGNNTVDFSNNGKCKILVEKIFKFGKEILCYIFFQN